MTQLSGSFSVEISARNLATAIAHQFVADGLADAVVDRLLDRAVERGILPPPTVPGEYRREPDPGQGTPDPHRGHHEGQGIGLDDLPGQNQPHPDYF